MPAMHDFSPLEQNLWSLGGLGAWTVVYVLMIRRGIKDKSYGMPVIALCVDIGWETYYTFFAASPLANKVGVGLYLITDLGVLATCLKYGKSDFDSPMIKKHFNGMVVAALIAGFFVVRRFDLSFHDPVGAVSATFTTMLLSVSLVAMILRRNSVAGQSFVIGVLILAGDVCGLFMGLIARQTVDHGIPAEWVITSNVVIISCNLFYLYLYFQIAKRDGIALWKRF